MARLSNARACHHCGEALPPVQDAFCPQCGEPLDEGAQVPLPPAAGNPYQSPQSGKAVARGKSSRVLVITGLVMGSLVFTIIVTPADPVSVTTVFPPACGLAIGIYFFAGWTLAEHRPRHALLGWAVGLAIVAIGSLLLCLTLSAIFRDGMINEPPRPRQGDELDGDLRPQTVTSSTSSRF